METLQTIELRKSTRSYKEEQVSEDSLEKVLHAGCTAPIGGAQYDKLHITVIQDAALLEKMTSVTAKVFDKPNMKPFYGAPTVILVSAAKRETPNVEYADAACIVENMHLAATDLGLGSVYLWGFLTAVTTDEELLKEFKLPEGFTPVSALALGYPTEPLTPKTNGKKTIAVNTIK